MSFRVSTSRLRAMCTNEEFEDDRAEEAMLDAWKRKKRRERETPTVAAHTVAVVAADTVAAATVAADTVDAAEKMLYFSRHKYGPCRTIEACAARVKAEQAAADLARVEAHAKAEQAAISQLDNWPPADDGTDM